MSERVIAIPI